MKLLLVAVITAVSASVEPGKGNAISFSDDEDIWVQRAALGQRLIVDLRSGDFQIEISLIMQVADV